MRKLARSKFWHDPQGGVAVMAALLMPMLLGFAALSVDLANARLVHSRLQLAADASALAAVQKLPDTAAATTAALDLASRNVPSGYGTVMRSTDLVWGTYDPDAQVFTATNVSPNAVQLSAGRLSSTSNALPTIFG